MLFEIILAILVGVLCGIVTGLTPGVHINLVSVIVVSLSAGSLSGVPVLYLVVFIVAMSVTHTFLDTLPSIYLGAPDEGHLMSALPGHKMLLCGRGHEAVLLTVMGSFFSLLLSVLFVPFFVYFVYLLQPTVHKWIGWILLVHVVFLIFREKRWWISLFLFSLSGILGIVVFRLHTVPQVLLPLLSGLFGMSLLLLSLREDTTVPLQQEVRTADIEESKTIQATIGATISGFFASFLPGLGSSQAAILVQQCLRNLGDAGFLVLVGGINTVNMVLSFVTLYALDKARNGSVVAISQLMTTFTGPMLFLCVCISLTCGGAAVLLTLYFSKWFCKLMKHINYSHLLLSIIFFVTLLVYYFSGVMGLVILITSTSIGLMAGILQVGKNHLMGCLLVPVMIYFLL